MHRRIDKLKAIASYAASIDASQDRAVKNVETKEHLGFWQTKEWVDGLQELLKDLDSGDEVDIGECSDGYHTFNELYEHRNLLYLAFLHRGWGNHWKSRKHFDGSAMDGWFIVGTEIPKMDETQSLTQISYHLPDRLWGLCGFLETHDKAPYEWDGHTSEDVLMRLRSLIQGKPLSII
jgi:hypothetical protein